MTELAEPIALGSIDVQDGQCPFDHSVEPPKVENQLIGEGRKLAACLKNRVGTHKYPPLVQTQPTAVLNPSDDRQSALSGTPRPVVIDSWDVASQTMHVHTYPVTCAAHHLIPAQESLKASRILAFMVKKGESAALKGAMYSTGVVWANVGYEVNGAQNGKYLPGSYAVGGGKGGLGLWTLNDDRSDEEDEDASTHPDPASAQLWGDLNLIDEANRKWLYVKQAVELAKGQFHDRHADYSRFVAEVLNKIFSDYRQRYRRSFEDMDCPKCKERQEKVKQLGIPTPFGLVDRLNQLSSQLRMRLDGRLWSPLIYTSKWGLAYMEARKANNPAAEP